MSVLLIVDVQKGFIGPATAHIPARVEALQDAFEHVVATRFLNPPGSPYRNWIGWSRMAPGAEEVELAFQPAADAIILDKRTYTCVDATFLATLGEWGADAVHLAGIATDNCVLKCAVDLFEAGIRPVVHADCCASHGGAACHEAGLMLLRRFIGEDQIISETE